MTTFEELPLEVIQTWKPEQLKEFCRKRDLKVSGTKAELVARVFAAAEMGIAIKPNAEERIATTEKEKAKLLVMANGTSVPDPCTLKDGWLKETEGMTSWPPIYLSDITLFLMAGFFFSVGNGNSLKGRLAVTDICAIFTIVNLTSRGSPFP